MRRDQVIDLLHSGVFHRVHDAPRVARGGHGADIAGIHQQRFMRRRNEQYGVAPFDVDHVDIEGWRSGLRRSACA